MVVPQRQFEAQPLAVPASSVGGRQVRVCKPPRQDRSLRTFDLLLDASERLLKLRSWEDISIVDIMREAACSNGAIYGRFKNKDEVLVALYDRHDAHRGILRSRTRPARAHDP